MNDTFIRREELAQFIQSLNELNKELDAKHVVWREAWIRELRATQAAKDAAMRERILRERAEWQGRHD